ncbi:unnamed protein product, partial [Sphacelaria rigidula]
GADLLEEDRRTRRAQEERTGVRIERLMGRTAKIKEGSKAEREIMETWLVARSRRERALAKYLIRKGAQARSADENVRQFAAGFRASLFRYAANSLVDVVTRIFTEIVDGRREEILGKHLKMWRSWYMQRISVRLYNRARLRNWLRICGRLRYLWRGMPLYRELRMKWSVFHLLLRSINERLKYGTPGEKLHLRGRLPTMLGRRRELLLGYSNHLRASGFTGGRYAPEVLLPVTLDELAMMQRWKQHVQAKKSADLVTDSFRKRRHARIVRVVFDGWRTGIGPKQRNRAQAKAAATAGAAKEAFLAEKFTKASATLGETRTSEADVVEKYVQVNRESWVFRPGSSPAATVMMVPSDGWSEFDGTVIWQPRKGFAEKRAKADLKVARRTVVAAWRGSLARDIGLRQAKQQRKTKQLARREPTFKKFVEYHTWQATERVRTEARLLVDAFLNRGRLKFQDLETRVTVGRAIDDGISPGELHFHDRCVPGSCLVCEVRVMTRIGEGVVGIQLVMKVGGMRTEELSLHGSAAGESRSTRAYTFTVDAPVERLSRFECEHNKGLIERLRVVTSGGRISAWFGDRLTANHSLSMLPDWRYDSLAATTAAAAAAARAAVGSCASDSLSSDEIDAATRERRAAASEAAAETAAAAAAAPGWDPQKEYVTGLFGSQAHGRLVGLGVITRHVTNSHVFSYLWEAPEDDEGVIQTPPVEALELEELTADNMTKNGSSSERSLGSSASGMSSSVRSLQSRSSSSSMPLPRGPSQVATGGGVAVDGEPGNGQSCMGSATAAAATAALAPAPVLSRAEAKQQKFAREMREREKKKAERERETKQREENLERLMRGGNSADESNGDSATARGRTPAPPTPQEEFASLLRMRRTDARHALERSLALARAARHYRGRFGSDRSAGALNNLSVVMGLTTWFYAALLPQLVPLPVPAATTSGLFHRGETQLMAARAIKARGDSLNRQMQSLLEERQQRPRRGVMSPAMRATEMLERE